MNNIKVFTHPELGQIRTMQRDGEIWFVGKDIAERLGYTNTRNALAHVDDEDKLTSQIGTSGQNRKMIIINESGLYSLILSSKLPTAKAFKRWVTSEVLPTIRKTGMYRQAVVPKPNYDNVGYMDIPSNLRYAITTSISANQDALRCLMAILNLVPAEYRTPVRILIEEYGSYIHTGHSTREIAIEECGEDNFLRYARETTHCPGLSEA